MPRNDKKQRTVMRTQAALTVTASRANAAPVFTVQPSGVVSFTQGNAGTQDVSFTATDPNNDPITFALVGSPPAGISYQFFTGFVRFSYTSGGSPGSGNVSISADDGQGNVTQSTQFTVTLVAASAVSWASTPIINFEIAEIKTVSVLGNLVNYNGGTDTIYVSSGTVAAWCPFNGTGFGPSSGTQVDTDDFGPIRLGVSRSGGTPSISNPFNVTVSPAPVVEDVWERLDAAASFNAEPLPTQLKGPSFGGAAIAPNGDVFFRNGGSVPNWNCWFRWSTKTLVGVDDTPITPLPGGATTPTNTHNHSWCVDPDRNVLWSSGSAPTTPGWHGHLRYDIATNTQTNPLYTNRSPSIAGDPGHPSGPFHLALCGINCPIDYFGGYLYGWGNYSQVYNPIYRMHVATALAGNFNTRETMFVGDLVGTGIGVPALYASDEYPDLVSGFDSRTGQLYYVDQNLDLWINNSVPDGTSRNWVKIPVYGTKPTYAPPSEHRRWACLAEWANCIVVVTWTAASFPNSYTSIIDLSTLMWRLGPSGANSPVLSTSYGDLQSRYSGIMRQDRINKRLIAIVPHGNGTALYQLHVAGPTL